MRTAAFFSAVAIVLLILKTAWPVAAPLFYYVQIYLLLAAYLGFEHSLLEGGIPTLLMGVFDSTFSGDPGAAFVAIYGCIFLVCFTLRNTTNLTFLVYRMIVVLFCGLLACVLLEFYLSMKAGSMHFEWQRILVSSVITAMVSPVFFYLFGSLDGLQERLFRRVQQKEAA